MSDGDGSERYGQTDEVPSDAVFAQWDELRPIGRLSDLELRMELARELFPPGEQGTVYAGRDGDAIRLVVRSVGEAGTVTDRTSVRAPSLRRAHEALLRRARRRAGRSPVGRRPLNRMGRADLLDELWLIAGDLGERATIRVVDLPSGAIASLRVEPVAGEDRIIDDQMSGYAGSEVDALRMLLGLARDVYDRGSA